MSMGGDFYAISDDQLTRLLDGTLDYVDFLCGQIAERPRECYANGEYVWYELCQILGPEDGCGSEQTDAIPEIAAYSFSDDVESVAKMLAMLGDEEIRLRYSKIEAKEPLEDVLRVIKELVVFYQRAVVNKDAILFRVT